MYLDTNIYDLILIGPSIIEKSLKLFTSLCSSSFCIYNIILRFNTFTLWLIFANLLTVVTQLQKWLINRKMLD